MGRSVTKQVRFYFFERDITLREAAKKIGYHHSYLSELLARDDLSNDQREKIVLAYPEMKSFLVPDWASSGDDEWDGQYPTGNDYPIPLSEIAAVLETIRQVMASDNIPEIAGRNGSWFADAAAVVSKVERDLRRQVAAIDKLLQKGVGQ